MSAQLHNSPVDALSRILDVAPDSAHHFVFVVGSAGSGKTTTVNTLAEAIGQSHLAIARFDDRHVWDMPRWSESVDAFPSVAECQKYFLGMWVDKVRSRHTSEKLVICDVNAEPFLLRECLEERGLLQARIVLMQPEEEVRVSRLSNDPTRKQFMAPQVLMEQMKPDFSLLVIRQAQELGIPRFFNHTAEKGSSEIASFCIRLVRGHND